MPEETPYGYTRVHVYIVLAAYVRCVALEGGQVKIYRGYEYYINRWKTYAFFPARWLASYDAKEDTSKACT